MFAIVFSCCTLFSNHHGRFAFEGLYKPDGAGSKQHEEAQGPMPRPNRLVALGDCKSQSLKI